MPIIKSAKKAARQAKKRRANNIQIKNAIKTALRAFKAKPSAETAAKVQSEYDKAVKKDLMKKNTASRRKAAVAKIAKQNGVKLATGKTKSAQSPKAAKVATPKTAPTKAGAKASPKKTASKASVAKAATKKPVAKKTSTAKSSTKTSAKKNAK